MSILVSGFDRKTALGAAFAAALSLCPLPGLAQDASGGAGIEEKREALEDVEGALKKEKAAAEALSQEMARLQKERADINARLISAAAGVQKLEGEIFSIEARLTDLQNDQSSLQRRLKEQEHVIAEVIGALQRMGRNPPPAMVVQPDDVLGAVRSAILMGAVVPKLRDQALQVAADLAELKKIGNQITAQRSQLAKQQIILKAEHEDLSSLLAAREETLKATRNAFAEAQARAEELAGRAGSLKELIASLERERSIALARAEAGRQLESQPGGNVYAALSSPGRMALKTPFERLRGDVPLPAAGQWVTGFGEDDGLGGVTKGATLQTLPGASITSPAEGWVTYAGEFRSYGEILILDAGGGYHILMAGMERVVASTGQFVLTGEPVAQMGTQSAAIAGLGFSAAREKPMLYVEFRKDGSSIDPRPWWVKADERVSG